LPRRHWRTLCASQLHLPARRRRTIAKGHQRGKRGRGGLQARDGRSYFSQILARRTRRSTQACVLTASTIPVGGPGCLQGIPARRWATRRSDIGGSHQLTRTLGLRRRRTLPVENGRATAAAWRSRLPPMVDGCSRILLTTAETIAR
jgi:hypothetical protein